MTDTLFFSLLAAAFGLIIGSFLNVCISRLPCDYSIVSPRSHCPRCGSGIRWFDNIPLLSYLLLGGRCRDCRLPISWRYPAVELLTGVLFFYIHLRFGPGWAAAKWSLFAAILVELLFSDLETRILPDEFTIAGCAAGLLLAPVVPLPDGIFGLIFMNRGAPLASFLNSALSALLLAWIFYAMGTFYRKIRGREGLGFGDIKMIAMMGVFLGLEYSVFAVMVASILGSVIGLLWIKIRHKDPKSYELPFGSFLALGALIAVLTGI